MTTLQRLVVALIVLVALGSAAAYVATYLTLRDEAPFGVRAIWLMAALPFFLSVLLMVIIHRLWHGNLKKFRTQLDKMASNKWMQPTVSDEMMLRDENYFPQLTPAEQEQHAAALGQVTEATERIEGETQARKSIATMPIA